MSERKQQRVCAIVSGYFGAEKLNQCISSLLPSAHEIVLIDSEEIAADILSHTSVTDYRKKSLNDAITKLMQRPDSERADWLFYLNANEECSADFGELFNYLAKRPAHIAAVQLAVSSTGKNGNIEYANFENRCVRMNAQPGTGFLNRLQFEGESQQHKSIFINRHLDRINKDASSPVFTRMRDDAVRYWERCPEDLAAVFSFYQFLHWIEDYDEIVNNCVSTIANHLQKIEANSEYWGFFTIWAEACYQKKEIEKFTTVFDLAKNTLPAKNLDFIYISCLQAKLANNPAAVNSNSELYISKLKSVLNNKFNIAKNSLHTLKFEENIRSMRISSLATLEKWQAVYAGLRQLGTVPSFDESKAGDLLQEMQFIPGDKLSTILTILWKKFTTPGFVLETLKVFPLESLNQKGRDFLEEKLVPGFREQKDYDAGILFMQLGLYQDALDIFLTYQTDPGVGEGAMFNAAQMFLELGYFEDAIKILNALLQEYPANYDARLLFEGLKPDVGDVSESTAEADDEIEGILLEAVEAIAHYSEKRKYDPIYSIVKQVHDVLAPYSELKVEIYDDLPGAFMRIESLAISHCYLKLADEVQKLKSSIKIDESAGKIKQ